MKTIDKLWKNWIKSSIPEVNAGASFTLSVTHAQDEYWNVVVIARGLFGTILDSLRITRVTDSEMAQLMRSLSAPRSRPDSIFLEKPASSRLSSKSRSRTQARG